MALAPNYVRPQAVIQQEFRKVAQAVIQPQLAVLIGAEKLVLEYTDPDDRFAIGYGDYNPAQDVEHSYKSLPDGAVVEQDAVRLFLEEIFAEYASLTAADTIERGTAPNQIQFNAGVANGNFKAFKLGTANYPRHASFKNRDVAIGDRVEITANGETLKTRIIDFKHATVAATVAATATPGAETPADQVQAEAVGVVDDKGTDHVFTVNTATTRFKGNLAKGYINDVYTLECTQAGTVGVTSANAKFKVTSVNGDNVAEIQISALGTAVDIGTRGLRVQVASAGNEAFVVGEKYTFTVAAAYEQQAPTTGGTYDGPFDTTYKVRVVKGGLFTENPQVIVTTSTGIDQGGPITVSYNTSFKLGNYGVTLKFPTDVNVTNKQNGLMLGETYTVAVTAAKKGGVSMALLANPIPDSLAAAQGDDLQVKFFIYKDSQEIQVKGYPDFASEALTPGADSFTLKAGIQITDASWTDVDQVSPLPLQVSAAKVFVTYTALKTENAGVLRSLSDLSSVPVILGKTINANPLANAVNYAAKNAGGQAVYFVSVASEDVEGFQTALEGVESSREVYFPVACSDDREILGLIDAHVQSLSSDSGQNWRFGVVSAKFDDTIVKYGQKTDGNNWAGYVAVDPVANPAQYTYVTIPGATFITDGIRPGDWVRSDFDLDAFGNPTFKSVKVKAVLDEENLVLASPGFSNALGDADNLVQIQVVRVLTNDEFATNGREISASFGSRRISNVFPNFGIDGPNYLAAAVFAGLASSVAPHQPLTNVKVNGFEAHSKPFRKLTPTQLDRIAGGGTLILTRDTPNGPVYVRHALTTDYSDATKWSISFTRNYDSIARYFSDLLNPFIGQYNIHENFLQLVDVQVRNGLNYLSGDATKTATAGPQIVSWDEQSLTITQNPTARTLVNIAVDWTGPLPADNIEFKLTAGA